MLTTKETEDLVRFRRLLHRYPELSHCEEETASRIVQRLEALPLELRTQVAGHGVVADLRGEKPGPVLLYRADIDALPIQEVEARKYASDNPGVMHACGHDVHTTIGVGVAEVLSARREALHGTIRFVFQPAEEAAAPPGQVIGAEAMALDGVLDGVQAAFAVHCMPDLDVEHFAFGDGAVWASSDVFSITLRGQSAHAAYPHQGRDALQAAAALATHLSAIAARLTDALSPCVVSVGQLHAGTAHNIIAPIATLSGIVRAFQEGTRHRALEAVRSMAVGIAAAHGVTADVQIQSNTKAVLNHTALQEHVTRFLRESLGDDGVRVMNRQMGAEDFSAFGTRVPGCYAFVGIRNEAKKIVHALHTPQFDVDERCIPFAVEHLSNLLLWLSQRWPELGVAVQETQ